VISNAARGDFCLELFDERVASLSEDEHVAADGDVGEAHIEVGPGIGFDRCEDADRLADRLRATAGFLDRPAHVRMAVVPEMAERCREIRWSDEDAVDAFHSRDRLERVDRGARFQLRQHAHLAVCPREVVRDAAIPVRAVHGCHAAHSMWRIARRRHGARGLLG
jgi:hypothetical protein